MLPYLQKTQMCIVCGKIFVSTPDERQEEFHYNRHYDFSKNVKSIMENNTVSGAVNDFFKVVGEADQDDMMEFLDCLSRYEYEDKEMLADVCEKIQERIEEIE